MFNKNNLKIAKLGEEILRKKAKKVKNIFDENIQELISDMQTSLKENDGVGLAAPQVFHSLQIMIISSHANARYPKAPNLEPMVMINPKVVKTSKKKQIDWEGCLSIPSIRAKVPRHEKITVKYTTQNNVKKRVKLKGFVARVFQHEYDHLKGLVFLDQIVSSKDIISEEIYFKR